jgi:AraC-like DNA-binding protein
VPSPDHPSVLAKAPGSYREFSPPVALRRDFSRVWVHVVPAGLDERLPVVPDGHVDLQCVNGQLRIAGPDTSVNQEAVPAAATIIGFRFRPGAASRWLEVPLSNLVDRRVELTEFWGGSAKEIGKSLAGCEVTAVISKLGEYLRERAQQVPARDFVAEAIFDALVLHARTAGELTRRLTTSLGISPRGLRRHTLAAFGYGSKTLHRILRFQGFLRAARSRGAERSLAALALDAGYTDQSHLCRDSAVMTGMSPTSVMKRLLSQ